MKNWILVLVVAVLWTSALSAQNTNTMSLDKGMHFIVAFGPVSPNVSEKPLSPPMELGITSFSKATVTIKSKQVGVAEIDDTLTIVPPASGGAGTVRYQVKTPLIVSTAQEISQRSIEVISDVPVSVFTRQRWSGNGEESSILPVIGWGSKYHVMSWASDRYGYPTKIFTPGYALIVASEDNTTVSIYSNIKTESGPSLPSIPARESTSITLNAYDVFLIKNIVDTSLIRTHSSDLSGSEITSDKPIMVVSGHTKGSVVSMPDLLPPTGMYSTGAHFVRSNLHESVLPVSMADTSFVVVPIMYTPTRKPGGALPQYGIANDSGDVVRLMATENETIVYKRDDLSGLNVKLARLQAGQSWVDSVVTRSSYYSSTKPITVAQYGKSFARVLPPTFSKDGDATQGHPTVEAGMPCLQMVPSTNRWISSGSFNADQGLDNFIQVVFVIEDSARIFIDGKTPRQAQHTIVPIPYTPYGYVRTPVSDGDHSIWSNADSTRFMAWYNASSDGLQQGHAAGRALGANYYVQGSDTIVISEGMPHLLDATCGDGVKTVNVSGTTGLSMIYPTTKSNYSLIVEDFEQGADEGTFAIEVVDKSLPANVTVRVVARSGVYVEQMYSYTPSRLTLMNSIIVPQSSPRARTCFDVALKNNSTNAIQLRGFSTAVSSIEVDANEPLPITIAPDEERTVTVCYRGFTEQKVTTTLLASIDCYAQSLDTVELNIGKSTMSTADAVFGTVSPNSAEQERTADFRNVGSTPLVVDSLSFERIRVDAHFAVDESALPQFPLQLLPTQAVTFYVKYKPDGDTGVHSTSIRVFSNSASQDSLILCSAHSTWTVGVDEESGVDLSVRPNPVSLSGVCTVDVPINSPVSIVDAAGRVVASFSSAHSGAIIIHPKRLGMSVGTYFVVSSERAQQQYARIVVID